MYCNRIEYCSFCEISNCMFRFIFFSKTFIAVNDCYKFVESIVFVVRRQKMSTIHIQWQSYYDFFFIIDVHSHREYFRCYANWKGLFLVGCVSIIYMGFFPFMRILNRWTFLSINLEKSNRKKVSIHSKVHDFHNRAEKYSINAKKCAKHKKTIDAKYIQKKNERNIRKLVRYANYS